MPKVYGQKKKTRFYLCILYNTEQLLCLTTILHRQAPPCPSNFNFNSTHTRTHSHSLLIFLWQLIVKVDTEVRRKSHLRAASPLPNLISRFPPRIAIPPPIPFWLLLVVLAQLCVVCCVDKKIYWHFVFFVPYPHSLPLWPGFSHWAAWRVNAESYVIIKIILRDCVDFFLGHLPE